MRRDCEKQFPAVFLDNPYCACLFADKPELFCRNANRLGFEIGIGPVFDFDFNAFSGGCAGVEI